MVTSAAVHVALEHAHKKYCSIYNEAFSINQNLKYS
jgi:uncharacterized OsmC-like protein